MILIIQYKLVNLGESMNEFEAVLSDDQIG